MTDLITMAKSNSSITTKVKPNKPPKSSARVARFRSRKAVTVTNIKAAIRHYRLRLKLPPVDDGPKSKDHPLFGKPRPNYLPPPEVMKNMSEAEISEWKRKERLKRKALSMKENRARKREEFEELKNQLYELVCRAKGDSISLTKPELISKYTEAEMPEPVLQLAKDSAKGDSISLTKTELVSKYAEAEMPDPMLSLAKDCASVDAILPIKEQCDEDMGSLGPEGELLPLSSDDEPFPIEEILNDVDLVRQEFAHDILPMS